MIFLAIFLASAAAVFFPIHAATQGDKVVTADSMRHPVFMQYCHDILDRRFPINLPSNLLKVVT
jgi:hypothetical protein